MPALGSHVGSSGRSAGLARDMEEMKIETWRISLVGLQKRADARTRSCALLLDPSPKCAHLLRLLQQKMFMNKAASHQVN